jgi:prepilin-type N-terminal cleavage/methylation domain-containing protein
MINQTNKGFTLIELLVVITIIGILSSVVMNFFATGRNNAADSTIKSNLSTMRGEGENNYDDSAGGFGFKFVCASGNMSTLFNTAKTASGGSVGECTATNSGTAWAAWVPLKSSPGGAQVWCVDSTGASKQIAKPAGAGKITVCP